MAGHEGGTYDAAGAGDESGGPRGSGGGEAEGPGGYRGAGDGDGLRRRGESPGGVGWRGGDGGGGGGEGAGHGRPEWMRGVGGLGVWGRGLVCDGVSGWLAWLAE